MAGHADPATTELLKPSFPTRDRSQLIENRGDQVRPPSPRALRKGILLFAGSGLGKQTCKALLGPASRQITVGLGRHAMPWTEDDDRKRLLPGTEARGRG